MKVLILGGTGEARALAARLHALGDAVTTSLAGRTRAPIPPAGELRVGGFGGAAGLANYLEAHGVDRLVDATHPYAGRISGNAIAAAGLAGVPLLRLMRPAWPEPPGANWVHVPSVATAAESLPRAARVLVTTGHADLAALLAHDDLELIVRLIEPPEMPLPPHARLLLGRPPYPLADERALMTEQGITHLVSKNSGGPQTAAKLEAARQLGLTVVMVDRPAYGPAHEVGTVDEALAVLHPPEPG
jgi:precorrin-6A/cobalt-precorrin-6A reductase